MTSATRVVCFLFTIFFLVARAHSDMTPTSNQRIVFLGDSITDGHTYPLLIQQALREAGKPVPVCINAGIGGDTVKGMRARLDRDVFVHHPTLVTFLSAANDASHKVAAEDFESDLDAIAARMKEEKIPLILFTP